MYFVRLYQNVYKSYPFSCSFTTCFVKGSISDLISQLYVENKSTVDKKRLLSFSTFSGLYLGCGQHVIYNTIFTRLFGASTSAATCLKKTAADFCVHVPFLYLPLYYSFENTMLGGTPKQGLEKLYNYDENTKNREITNVMKQYGYIFPAVHFLNFKFTPTELRISVVASASLLWLVILSTISHKKIKHNDFAEKSE